MEMKVHQEQKLTKTIKNYCHSTCIIKYEVFDSPCNAVQPSQVGLA